MHLRKIGNSDRVYQKFMIKLCNSPRMPGKNKMHKIGTPIHTTSSTHAYASLLNDNEVKSKELTAIPAQNAKLILKSLASTRKSFNNPNPMIKIRKTFTMPIKSPHTADIG